MLCAGSLVLILAELNEELFFMPDLARLMESKKGKLMSFSISHEHFTKTVN